ncbi:translocase subunit TIM44 [Cryptosporidium canis]|uniref:Translocase subunit TIM44 n=1 Tax=Cryptosporidium canis TaxID=195482 RepID=A0ABQ8P745_9CRYT|nr:translocase subunit TIM44 [Cryptosporidium canis]
MKGPGNHATKKIFTYYLRSCHNKGGSARICSLVYLNNRYYTHLVKFIGINSIQRRLHSFHKSYYDQFISKLKNEVKRDQILQDDIKFLKIKYYDFCSKFSDKSSVINSLVSNYISISPKIYEINKLALLNLEKTIIFSSRIFKNNFFSKCLDIIKIALNDETDKSKIERELSNWKTTRNTNLNLETKDKTVRNLNTQNMGNKIEYSIILKNYSFWNRICLKFGDSPLLRSIFGGINIRTIFNQNKITRVVQQMKTLDPNFSLSNFIPMFETYILPKFMESYLNFDEQNLRLHCSDLAFNQLSSSMKELKKMGLHLKINTLQLGDIEFRGIENSKLIFSHKNIKARNSQPIQMEK